MGGGTAGADRGAGAGRRRGLRTAGIVAGAAALGAAAWLGAAHLRWDAALAAEEAALLAAAGRTPGPVVTEAMLAGLPEPAARFLRAAGVVGTRIPRVVRLTQRGRIRSGPEAGWMPLEAEEVYSTSPPAFLWRAWLPSRGLPVVMGRDVYRDGQGSIVMRALGTVPVAEERGEALGAAGLMRYLNEMAWFPAAFLGEGVTLAPAGPDAFRVRIEDRGLVAEAVVEVDAEGRLATFRARRFNTATGRMEDWETPMTRHGPLAGLVLPLAGQAVWHGAQGDFAYAELEVTAVRYDGA